MIQVTFSSLMITYFTSIHSPYILKSLEEAVRHIIAPAKASICVATQYFREYLEMFKDVSSL